MEREVRQLMPQRADEVGLIGAEENGAGVRHGDRHPPCGRPATSERVEQSLVGRDDEAERLRVTPAEAGPLGGAVGDPGELDRERALGRPRDDGHAPDLPGGRSPLEEEEKER